MLSSVGRHRAYTQADNAAGRLIRITGQARSNDQMRPVLCWDYQERLSKEGIYVQSTFLARQKPSK